MHKNTKVHIREKGIREKETKTLMKSGRGHEKRRKTREK